MKNTDYKSAVELITSQEKFHICLGLDRIGKILDLMGKPQDGLKFVHVAGTNGKGSVCAMLSAILTQAGYKTGLFTSPHILDYTERIKINNKDIPQEDFARLIFEVCELANKHEIYLTEFELLTAIMFKYFAEQKIDICVLETGLGGRFDATNVIKENILSVLTSISFDHTDRLGDTIEKIAFEKAGIIKPGCPAVLSKKNAGYETIIKEAKNKNAAPYAARTDVKTVFENGVNYALFEDKKYEFNLLGLYQAQNLELVLEVIKNLKDFPIKENDLKIALKKVSWACRLQYIKEKNLIIDGAHNPDGARMLRESLDYYFQDSKKVWIYGTLKNKDYKTAVKTLFQEEDDVYLYNFQHENHAAFEEIANCTSLTVQYANIPKVVDLIESKDLKIICGSIYMIGEILNSNSTLKNIAVLDNIY